MTDMVAAALRCTWLLSWLSATTVVAAAATLPDTVPKFWPFFET